MRQQPSTLWKSISSDTGFFSCYPFACFLVILGHKGPWEESLGPSDPGGDDGGSVDSGRSVLDVGEDATEAGLLWFWGLGTQLEECCEPSTLTSFFKLKKYFY